MHVFHCNYPGQVRTLFFTLGKTLYCKPGYSHLHNYIVVKEDHFYSACSISVGTPFTHLSLDDTAALELLNEQSVIPYLMGFKITHTRD